MNFNLASAKGFLGGLIALIFGLILLPQEAPAAPSAQIPYEITQPDGSRFTAVTRGDEWSNRVETRTGYTVKKDTDGYWRYVEEYRNGEPILGNTRADTPPPRYLQQNIRSDVEPLLLTPLKAQENVLERALAAPVGSFSGPVLFILAQFTDRAGSTTEANWGIFVTNNIVDYFNKTSHGRVTLTPASESFGTANNGVVGWVNLNYAHPNTGDTIDTRNQTLTRDAILAANPYVNFATYDTNSDGYVDASELAVVVIVAGYESAYSGAYNPRVWGHKWSLASPPTVDGKIVGAYHSGGGGYAQFGELHRSTSTNQHQATLGIMVHELGHLIFGLPDLYDTDYSSSGVGAFCLTSGGSWGKASTDTWSGQTPVLASAWVRYNRGWDNNVEGSGTVSITAAGASTATSANTVYRATTSLGSEYFLVENRQPLGYDRGLELLIGYPFGGVAIWHIDETRTGNTDDSRRLVDLEEADGTAMGTGSGQVTDLWYAGNATTFNNTSNPNSKLYNGSASGVDINSISSSSTVMTARFGAGAQQPDFVVTGITLSPSSPRRNSTFSATVTVKNQGTASGAGRYLDVWTNQATSRSCGAAGNQRKSVGTLAAGASASFTFTGLSAGARGSKTFRAFVDSQCGTAESNESNNQLTKTYTVN